MRWLRWWIARRYATGRLAEAKTQNDGWAIEVWILELRRLELNRPE